MNAAHPECSIDRILARLRLQVGMVRYSDWLVVDQSMINDFADVTEDREFIHVEPERAAATSLGGTIAHGLLTLSLLPHLLELAGGRPSIDHADVTLNYGFDTVRFITPVRTGSRVRLQVVLAEADIRGTDTIKFRLDCTVAIEGEDRPALAAQWLMQTSILNDMRPGETRS